MPCIDTYLEALIKRINQDDPDAQVDLDDLVHDAKGAEAAEINNQGMTAQVAYLSGIAPAELPAEVMNQGK